MSDDATRAVDETRSGPVTDLIEAGALPVGGDLPDAIDPMASGMLMDHQLDWIEDKSPLKICEKCRRSGFTFAEALDDTITAMTAKNEGGDNVFYMGDTREKGREFINYCASFARGIAGWDGAVEEFIFADQKDDGSTNEISAFRISFASGNRIVALSSRAENIRGLQGIVVIDEAAFHKDVGEVIDSALALLIWGGQIRIISTHNGMMNPFNDLVVRTRAGKTNYSLHRITFDEVVENGLYERAKSINPGLASFDEWYDLVRGGYVDENRMREELDAIPRDAEGSALARVEVEACKDPGVHVIRLAKPEAFRDAPEPARRAEIDDWLREVIAPVMAKIDINRRTVFGGDIARRGHGSVFWIAQIGAGLRRETLAVIELRKIPFAQQEQILRYVLQRCGRRWKASLDASGLGMQMAEAMRDEFGPRVAEVTFSVEFYRQYGAALVTSIQEQSATVPADDDIISDICALAYVNGVVKIPDKHETTGADGGKRHADAAVALMLIEDAAGVEPPNMDGVQTGGDRAGGGATYPDQIAATGDGRMTGSRIGGAGWGTVTGGVSFDGFGDG